MEALQQGRKINTQPQEINFGEKQYVKEIEIELLKALSSNNNTILSMCGHILSAGGKRVRPLLVLHSGLIFSGLSKKLLNAAVAAELIHMASLVHDDIIDEADRRRGRYSINKKWGNQFAVICGDFMFAKAFSILSNDSLTNSMNFMVEAIQNMCSGEIVQTEDKFNTDIDLKSYYERIGKKTGIFLKCCCKSGASLGGADGVCLNIIGEYGLNLGLAFQIVDDVLDFCGNRTVMGKPKFEDLVQGNITLPIILMLKNEKYGRWINSLIEKKIFTQENLNDIAYALNESGAIEKSFCIAEEYLEKSRSCLDLLPSCESVEFLYQLTDMMKSRVN